MDFNRTPSVVCWNCDTALDAAWDPVSGEKPEPGNVSLCVFCGVVSIFDMELKLRAPSIEVLDEMSNDLAFMLKFATFSWNRMYMLVREKYEQNPNNSN